MGDDRAVLAPYQGTLIFVVLETTILVPASQFLLS